MLTVIVDNEAILKSLENGANGYILKDTYPPRIIDAIRDAFNGFSPLSPKVSKTIIDKAFNNSDTFTSKNQELSEREKDVLSLLAKGLSQKMAATELGVSVNTVKTLVSRIYDKLNVHSITEAVAKVFLEKM
jgi:DNA-binding NarL/FixJ family response regulator